MHILQLGKFYPLRGGVEKVAYDLTEGLPAYGMACDMLCAASAGKGGVTTIRPDARLITCRTWKKVAATMIAPTMITTLQRIKQDYDIVHVHHPDPMACLALYLSGYKGKVAVHWHSDIQKQKTLLRFYQPLQDWMLRRADVVIGTTPVYLQESPFLKQVSHKTACVPIGVKAMPVEEERVKDILERYAGRKIVFSLGRLVHYKGYHNLVKAARYLPESYVILIGGTGTLKKELQTLIRTEGLEGKVSLLGRIDERELPAYYQACSVFCLSSVQKTEAFGIVQIEAMSCGKPVVATNIPQSGVPWVNAHGVSGLNVEPGDAQALADAILEITVQPETYSRYARQALARYRSMFTEELMLKRMAEIYRQLITNH